MVVRRSSRSRRPAHSIYDEAIQAQIEEELKGSARKKSGSAQKQSRNDVADSEDDSEGPTDQHSTSDVDDNKAASSSGAEEEDEDAASSDDESVATSSSSSSSSSEDDDEVQKPAAVKRTSSSPKKKSSRAGSGVRFTKDTSFVSTNAQHQQRGGGRTPSATTALFNLAKKVLHKDETPQSSTLAALLQAGTTTIPTTTTTGASSSSRRRVGTDWKHQRQAQIEAVAVRVIQDHLQDPNKAQIDLFNLLFRSVGGRYDNVLDAANVDLDELENDQWEEIIAAVACDMESTPADVVLLSADPLGAVHAEGKKKAVSSVPVAALEYRKLYSDFWYILGVVAVSESSNEGNDDQEHGRLQMDVARDILHRVIEVTGVGQPDIRAAAIVAVYQLAIAMLERGMDLEEKLGTAERQLTVAQRAKSTRKAEALSKQIKSWNRAALELRENVESTVINAVFGERFKDRNKHIRALSLETMSTFAQICPDTFLKGSYLKYLGWMLLDKEPIVRKAALVGLAGPLKKDEINTKSMQVVFHKFLQDIANRSLDVDADVQDSAMDLLLLLLRQGFLDSQSPDDPVWSQVNLRALDPEATPHVRKQALYFVIEQLDAFAATSGDGPTSESSALAQIDDLSKWVAHTLSDSDVPVESVRYHISDLVVRSLWKMEQHKHLVTNWKVWIRALESDYDPSTDSKLVSVRQRVVLRMLACAAELEVQSSEDGDFVAEYLDPDLLAAQASSSDSFEVSSLKSKRLRSDESSLEVLTDVLLEKLPDLLVSFKGESSILSSLTNLPRYMLVRQLSQAGNKSQFQLLLRRIADTFLESTDKEVLIKCSVALSAFSEHKHAHTTDSVRQLKKVATSLRNRIAVLMNEKTALSSVTSSDDIGAKSLCDIQHSLLFCLRRLSILSRRTNVDALLDEGADARGVPGLRDLCNAIEKDLASELKARALQEDGNIPDIWMYSDKKAHPVVADSLNEFLWFLLSGVSHRLEKIIAAIDSGVSLPDSDHEERVVLVMREQLLKLLSVCFDQHVSETSGNEAQTEVLSELIRFTSRIQQIALPVCSDVRNLFPKKWVDSSSPFLRKCALSWDQPGFSSVLVGGTVRLIEENEEMLRGNDSRTVEDKAAAKALLLVPARACLASWDVGHRAEGGVLLSHLIGSGSEASRIIQPVARLMKKLNPGRFIESHFYCLTTNYEKWLEMEPYLENDRPTEEEIEAFEEEERRFRAKQEILEALASRLASTLGVGRLSERKLEPLLERFVVKGIEWATDLQAASESSDEGGRRLAFLRLMSKYIPWIRKHPRMLENVQRSFCKRLAVFRENIGFEKLEEADLQHFSYFRKALGLAELESERSFKSPNLSNRKQSVSPSSDAGDTDVEDASPATRASLGTTRSFKTRSSFGTEVSELASTRLDSIQASSGDESNDPTHMKGGVEKIGLGNQSSTASRPHGRASRSKVNQTYTSAKVSGPRLTIMESDEESDRSIGLITKLSNATRAPKSTSSATDKQASDDEDSDSDAMSASDAAPRGRSKRKVYSSSRSPDTSVGRSTTASDSYNAEPMDSSDDGETTKNAPSSTSSSRAKRRRTAARR